MAKKQSVGKRYGIAITKQYFGRQSGNAKLEAAGKRAAAKAVKEMDEAETINEEEFTDTIGYQEALNVYEAVKMAYSALTMQASNYILTGAIGLKGICKAEEEHCGLLCRPLLVFESEDSADVDSMGRPIDTNTETLEGFNTETEEGRAALMYAIVGNDNAYRYTNIGAAVCKGIYLKPTLINQNPAMTAQICDRGGNAFGGDDCAEGSIYADLLEVNESAHSLIEQAASMVADGIKGMKKYRFAAKVIEAFLGIDGAADCMAPSAAASSIAEMIERYWNPAAEELRSGRYVWRWNGSEERSSLYEEAIVSRFSDTTIKLIDTAEVEEDPPEEEVREAADKLTIEDMHSIGTFEAFIRRTYNVEA